MALQVEILTPSKILLNGPADEVVAPAAEGQVGILPQHAEYITTLIQGKLQIKQGSATQDFEIAGGLLTVAQDQVKILVDEVIAQ